MPPNKTGGKNYKKTKQGEADPILYELLPGQMYGRVIRLVGGCNVVVYCNDNYERICHIRGNMRRKVWLATGDIVLISLRDLDSSGTTNTKDIMRGDVCAKYDSRVLHRLQAKDPSINPRLFTTIEKTETTGTNGRTLGIPDDTTTDGYVFDYSERNVIKEGNEEYEDESAEGDSNDNDNDDNIDIDNI